MNKVKILLVGIGGYGQKYVEGLLSRLDSGEYEIVGAVDVNPAACRYLRSLEQMNVPMFGRLEQFYESMSADLVIVSTPIHYHLEHTSYALSHGSNVLCEKPVAATIQDARRMIEARDASGRFVAIGYQWSYTDAIQRLKRDILAGALGRPRRFKHIVMPPRGRDYYSRGWAARKRDDQGRWVLDSIANNAAAHQLHNMLYLLGPSVAESARLESVTAELYKANDIENFDTASIRVLTETGVEVLFTASHATGGRNISLMELEFDDAVVRYGNGPERLSRITAEYRDGRRVDYGSPEQGYFNKLWASLAAARDSAASGGAACSSAAIGDPENGGPADCDSTDWGAADRGPVSFAQLPCGIEAAAAQTLCINGAQESMPEITAFPRDLVRLDTDRDLIFVEGLEDALMECHNRWMTPSELGLGWARSGKRIDLRHYEAFASQSHI